MKVVQILKMLSQAESKRRTNPFYYPLPRMILILTSKLFRLDAQDRTENKQVFALEDHHFCRSLPSFNVYMPLIPNNALATRVSTFTAQICMQDRPTSLCRTETLPIYLKQ